MRIIAGNWRGRPLVAQTGSATRPTADRVRETLFSMLTNEQAQNEAIQDLQAQQYAQQQPQYAPPPPAPAAPAAPSAGSDDMVEQLTNLKSLLDQGILTQAEFDMQKQKLLAGA